MATPTKTFGQTLRELREAQGLTRRQLEDETGISQRHIGYLEKDEKEPGRRNLELLAERLGPKILKAAFPDLVILSPRSKERATARKLGPAMWGTSVPSADLALASG